jgi:hypothetical protein
MVPERSYTPKFLMPIMLPEHVQLAWLSYSTCWNSLLHHALGIFALLSDPQCTVMVVPGEVEFGWQFWVRPINQIKESKYGKQGKLSQGPKILSF